ncbi:MAG: thiamine pyrophosphate-requiring protein [Thalassovita sp.]
MSQTGSQGAQLSAGAAMFGKLKALGVDYVFTNSGTDFPPIIEGYAAAKAAGHALPQPIIAPHEHAAMSMAHGYYQISGQAQAVMLHTNVGLSNGITGAINAWCDQIPMIMMSGRTPTVEQGRFGARTVPIGWGQEMFDQTALVRETTKWDYELRFPEQIAEVLDRAWAIANSTPKGPVYLSLPREVLCEPGPTEGNDTPSSMVPVIAAVEPTALDQAARALAGAKSPLIIAQRGAGSAEAFAALSDFALEHAIPVAHYWSNQLAIPIAHPMQVGADPDPWLTQADVVLVINSLAPWFPDKTGPHKDATIIQLGPDPLFSRTPIRNFRADIALGGETDQTLLALIKKVSDISAEPSQNDSRRESVSVYSSKVREETSRIAETGCANPMTKEWVALCLGRAIKNRKATVFHELGCPLQPLGLQDHNSYFQEPHSGGLGWGFPAALGAQLADPERLVFATMGDGSYMFANPTACHFIAEAHALPVIVLVLNNEEWGAVRASVDGMYPTGSARQANETPMTSLRPSPDFTQTARASRAYTETICNGADLPPALERAITVATSERRQVLLNIAIACA